jgi:hypothetical protein
MAKKKKKTNFVVHQCVVYMNMLMYFGYVVCGFC